MSQYVKRLIEVDLPIRRISEHARREKSIRHGHISTLHIWWARRPLAACRSVILAALWPDPADPLCPAIFKETASLYMRAWHPTPTSERADWQDGEVIRRALLDFIADFANWDNSSAEAYLETSRALTQSAHEALGGPSGTRPLVIDPFAGGGAIPLEALRVGADAFASDLNPVAVLLNKVVLEYIPCYGQRLADEVRRCGLWIQKQAEQELALYYPKDPDGATPIAYIWARTIISEAPGQGDVPTEVPLMRSLWLSKKPNRRRALRWVRNGGGEVQTETVEVSYADGSARCVRRPILEVFEPKNEREVEGGTVARGAATCPATGYTTAVTQVRAQLKLRHGGSSDARLLCVVTTRVGTLGRHYRISNSHDLKPVALSHAELKRRMQTQNGSLPLVPDEMLDLRGIRHTWAMLYGLDRWGDYYTPRQLLTLTTLASLVQQMAAKDLNGDPTFLAATQACLALAISRLADRSSSLCTWRPQADQEKVEHVFTRQAVPMAWDFAEGVPLTTGTAGWGDAYEPPALLISTLAALNLPGGSASIASATSHSLPNDTADALITDPPYYDAVPYAYLADFFYVWIRRALGTSQPELFGAALVPKDQEIVVDRPHELSNSDHDVAYYERELTKAFREARRVVRYDGIGVIVFASKTAASWEAILQAVVDAGWIITGSWPIDTEMENRISARGQARLASSIHLACRPRENPDGALRQDDIGDWRDVLDELPRRLHAWMPHLAAEGVVGADAIFACLGPALEVFSRYSRVEKASGEDVPLKEYLEYVWAAVAREALSVIFAGVDASGLEPDARLTAMWLWTLNAGSATSTSGISDEEAELADDEETVRNDGKGSEFSLEFDAARKIAQGLGANLDILRHVVEVKGEIARLLRVAERAPYLLGKDEGQAPKQKGKRQKEVVKQLTLFQVMAQIDEEIPWGSELSVPPPGATVLDRVHQAMILFAGGRSEALKRFLVEEGAGNDARLWKLAQSLSALYPSGTDEKRWVDGVLARKKGLGF